MSKRIVLIATFLLLVAAVTSQAEDLYKASVTSQRDAELLNSIGADPLLRIRDGYLLLLKGDQPQVISSAGVTIEHVATDVDRRSVAIDVTLDRSNARLFPVVYQEEGVVLLRVTPDDLRTDGRVSGLAPVLTSHLKIVYREPLSVGKSFPSRSVDLDSIMSLIRTDSLQSYVTRLQAFPPRVTGSTSDHSSRDWLVSKFQQFGYDSVVLDSFNYGSTPCQNIVAYKVGSAFPDHHIVIGAHKDAVSGSPGADDNASGAAGVLEIARILKDIETEMTFVFVLFNAEEQGLYGSWHYADEAATRGDSIVFMLNLDMIGAEDNYLDATVYHGTDLTYANFWNDVADSLLNVTGHLSGTSQYSDHYPFQQNGYDVVFIIEYEFSSVYHSSHDSTSYMDFNYMTRIVKASAATAFMVDGWYIPNPGLVFTYPSGVPETVLPGVPTEFQVQITGASGGVPVEGSGKLHSSVGGGLWSTTDMTYMGSNLYEATLPAASCNDGSIQFYVSAEEAQGGEFSNPSPLDPFETFVATSIEVAFSDNFETNKGWSVSGGLWARGVPTGGGGAYGGPDPSGGHNSLNVFGYNLSGDYENSMPERHLTSPAINCSGLSGVKLNFWRWLGVEQPDYDHAYVRVSNNGTTWSTIWQNTAEVADVAWQEMEFDISSIADNQPAVYVRFTMGVSDGAWTYCGWNIDDLEVKAYVCEELTDSDSDGIADLSDNCPLIYNPNQEDADGDDVGDVCDNCTDTDNDGFGNPGFPASTCALDNCPLKSNPLQQDFDSDAIGDSCDNCIYVANADQTDSDQDGIGDVCEWACGDANGSEFVDIDDVVYLIMYVFSGGPDPIHWEAGDVNCSGIVDIDDIVYLINYIFAGGPAPCEGC
jgi:hypothetical protein